MVSVQNLVRAQCLWYQRRAFLCNFFKKKLGQLTAYTNQMMKILMHQLQLEYLWLPFIAV